MHDHTEHIKAKVGTDLKRIQRLYGQPSDKEIEDYEKELSAFLEKGYLNDVIYGFKREDIYISPTLKYSSKALMQPSGTDDDPGKILPGADVDGAGFTSYLTYSNKWYETSASEKELFRSLLPFKRTGAPAPEIAGRFV